jgi:acyl-CoA thioesterase
MNFLDATRLARIDGPRFRADVPDGWQQGRGAYGGLVLAYLVRAIEQHEGAPEKPLRSLTAAIGGPLATGPAEVHVERLRAGSSVVTLAARIVQGGEVPAHAVAILGKTRNAEPPAVDLVAPVAPAWRTVSPIPGDAPGVPPFVRHFEMRPVSGVPFSGGEPAVMGWVRTREPVAVKDAALLAALIDVWGPAEFSRMQAPRPVATIAFSMQVICGAPAMKDDAPLLFRSRTLTRTDGYLVELRELWTEAGTLVALNEQTIAIIK